jgi:hypothetical protein
MMKNSSSALWCLLGDFTKIYRRMVETVEGVLCGQNVVRFKHVHSLMINTLLV